MTDIILESVRALVLLGIVIFLWNTGRNGFTLSKKGWNFIIGGFGLLLMGSLVDITDNFEELNRFVIIGDTPTEAFLEKFVGFLGGFIMLAVGLIRWIPDQSTECRRAGQELQSSQERFKTLVETTNVVPWEFDTATMRFTYVGPQAVAMLGYPVEDWYAEGFWKNMIHPDDRVSAMNCCMSATAECKDHDFEYRALKADGSVMWLRDVVTVVAENGVAKGLRGIIIDITEQHERDRELRDHNERFNAALSNMSQGLCMFDGQQRLIVANEKYASMYGLSSEQVKSGTKLAQIVEHRIANGIYAGKSTESYIQERLEWGRSPKFESRIHDLSDGRTISINRQPLPGGGWVTTHEDITEQKQSKEALQKSEKHFRNLIEGSLQGVFIARNWKLVFANQALADIFGYESPECILALGDVKPLIAPDERDRIWGYKEAREKGGSAPEIYESKGLKKDGTIIYIEFRVRRVDWHGASAMQCVVLDINERKKVEYELIKHRDHLQQLVETATQELKAKAAELQLALAKEQELNKLQREFVSMASHEFRTPLSIIDATAQRMKSRANKNQLTPEDAVQRVEKIRAAVKRMTRLMESTLNAARMEEGKIKIAIKPCDIGKVVQNVCTYQQEIAQSHVISFEEVDLPETIQADTGSLEQAFTNLLSNAVKYAPDAPDVRVVARTEGDQVVISVRDHGIGIDRDELDRIGERFFRARTSTGTAGTGIGLNLAKTLVKMHDGTIHVESVKGQGSTFTIRLPIAGPDQLEQADSLVA